MITGLAVPVLDAAATHVLDSSLKVVTGQTALEKSSKCIVQRDWAIFAMETLLVCIIAEGGTGSRQGKATAARAPVLGTPLQLTAFLAAQNGKIVVMKCFKFTSRESQLERP